MWHLTKIPKIAHFYWGGEKLSYLRFLSVKTFRQHNPDWSILIHVPSVVSTVVPGWESFQQKDVNIEYDYFNKLNNIEDLKIITHNFNRYHFDNQAHEVHKSDFLRWKLLNKYGGLWSDIDILYTKPMWALPENTPKNTHIDTALCPLMDAKKHTVGFLLSSKKNNFFQSISKQARKQYTPTLYQCMGSDLINSRFKTFESLQKRFCKNNFLFLKKNCVYSITSKEIEMFYQPIDSRTQKKLSSTGTIGFHWFAGHPLSQQFENTLTLDNVGEYNNLLSTIIKEIPVETRS